MNLLVTNADNKTRNVSPMLINRLSKQMIYEHKTTDNSPPAKVNLPGSFSDIAIHDDAAINFIKFMRRLETLS